VFAETGLFIGFFLPGDSLLFTAGLLCSAGILEVHPVLLVILIIIAAVEGNMIGYAFGKKVGGIVKLDYHKFFQYSLAGLIRNWLWRMLSQQVQRPHL
jgi:membrane-associated protein